MTVVSAFVNGTPVTLGAGTTVDDLLASTGHRPTGIAVAINREVVPRSRWSRTCVVDDDQVEIVTGVPGG
ncbi:MAG: sulfur carrier protein ThiS [Actinomycetota bacterium]|nr:sulfur carrier protein ThiS [Actinomycetota bacterium]